VCLTGCGIRFKEEWLSWLERSLTTSCHCFAKILWISRSMLTAEAILARGFEIPQSRLYPLYQILDARKADENASERANQGQSSEHNTK